MKDIISPSQNAFVRNRQILDPALIANECLDSRVKTGLPGILCKLDVEKAFDHVNWGFLIQLLEWSGFSAKWRQWIFFCISTVRFSILINGTPCGFFESSKGLRQGNPLSPLLFVLVMEVLGRMLDKAIHDGHMSGFDVGHLEGRSLEVSHLLFADDTLIFCDADLDQVLFLRMILIWFEVVSGLKINLGKSELVPIGMVHNLGLLLNVLGCKQGTPPMKYLGLPLGDKCKDKIIWNPILEKIERRLAGWKRLIEKLQRDFLWGGIGDEPKFHLVKWAIVCTPIASGGLGIRKGWHTFSRHILYDIGDGSSVKFWRDRWCGETSLAISYPELFRFCRDQEVSVVEVMKFDNGILFWDVSFFMGVHARELEALSSFMDTIYGASVRGLGEDKMCWKFVREKGFTVRDYYNLLVGPNDYCFPWKSIWKQKIPSRATLFVWTVALRKCLTIDNLRRRKVWILDWCYMCKCNGESVDHLFLHCLVAMDMWAMENNELVRQLSSPPPGSTVLNNHIFDSMYTVLLFLGINYCSTVLPYVGTERTVMLPEIFSGMT
ncbi:uncharacterized protein LOC126719217 [Quercus robur]|uniref:uncharacterized protein LOC126719217 n=1 Tax=Quercus robur TaxID=38942 RepID=UPI00216240BC|nr:uncharacterized protein LOC126719217 [Quercus robur]